MKRILRCTCATMVLATLAVLPARGADYKTAHEVKPGDVISADIINELFEAVEAASVTVTQEDLLGTWVGRFYNAGIGGALPEWVEGPGAMYITMTNAVLTFTDYGDGQLELITSAPNPFKVDDSVGLTSTAVIVENALRIRYVEHPDFWILQRISDSRIQLNSIGLVSDDRPVFGIIDRAVNPPCKPHLDSAEAAGTNVVLTWQDCGSDEGGFAILRRDKVDNSYNIVQGVGPNATSCTNSVPASGFYWYRVAATNSTGSSLGSNVKRVTVP